MKLAEALALRAESNRRIEQLRSRIVDNARYQEGEEPAEDAASHSGSEHKPNRHYADYPQTVGAKGSASAPCSPACLRVTVHSERVTTTC
jgi:hypothetical protein